MLDLLASADRSVTVGCDTGPTIAVGGRLVRTSITATVGELRSGHPVPAQVCPDLSPDTAAFPDTDLVLVSPPGGWRTAELYSCRAPRREIAWRCSAA